VHLAQSSGQVTEFDSIRIFIDVKYEHALHLSDENTEKPLRLMRVGYLLRALHQQSERNVDLDKAIAAYGAAIRFMPDGHECRADLHSQLGLALLYRIEYSRDITDIEDAIYNFECSLVV
jgi:hypothetical protein